jgi:hypothetical protein
MSKKNNSDNLDNIENQNIKKKCNYKDYYEENKEKFQEKIICPDCGSEYKKYNKSHHDKTNKHQKALLVNKLNKLNNLEMAINKEKVLESLNDLKIKMDNIAKSIS